MYPNRSLRGYDDWNSFTESDFEGSEWGFLDKIPATPTWFRENDPNAFNLPTTYDPVLVNKLDPTVSNAGITDVYMNQFEVPGTSWSDVAKEITSAMKDIVQVGTPIAVTALSLMKSNQVSNDSIASLSNSLKQMGVLNQNFSAKSISDLASAMGVSVTGKSDVNIQQEIALALAKKELEAANAKSKSDDMLKYAAIGAGILFGFLILKKL